jgi:hypothetical protein
MFYFYFMSFLVLNFVICNVVWSLLLIKKFIFIWLKFSIICKFFSSSKKLTTSKFLGCFAYWNPNCWLWNEDPKSFQFEIRFQISKFLGSFAYWDSNRRLPKITKIRGYRIGVYNHFYLKLGLGIRTKITVKKENQN